MAVEDEVVDVGRLLGREPVQVQAQVVQYQQVRKEGGGMAGAGRRLINEALAARAIVCKHGCGEKEVAEIGRKYSDHSAL